MSKEDINVVIVEDYKLTRVALRYTLSDFPDIKIIGEFSCAKDCIDFLKNDNRTDIILMDLKLIGMQGLEATALIKKKYPHIKIAIITSVLSKKDVIESINAGASAYILKDFDFEELYDVIKVIHSGAMFFDREASTIAYEIFKKQSENRTLLKNVSKNSLTIREKEVLGLMAQGMSNTEISKRLYISSHTAKAHVSNIITKLSAKDRVHAAVVACKSGLLD